MEKRRKKLEQVFGPQFTKGLPEPKPLEREVKLIEDKGQFILRIPTAFNLDLGLKPGTKVKLRLSENTLTVEKIE